MADHGVCVADVDRLGWEPGEAAEVTWVNVDTVSEVRLSLLLRYGRDLPAGDVVLRIEARSPDALTAVDTVVFRIPPVPMRAGTGQGADFHETEQPYRAGVQFRRAGAYRFRIAPLDAPATGIAAVGLRVENSR